MLPIDFPGTNIILTRPEDMTDEQCSSLKAYKGADEAGNCYFVVALQPNKEDIDAIKAGRPIMVRVMGNGFPPISVYTYDENLNANV